MKKKTLKQSLEASAVKANEIPGFNERRARILAAEKRCEKLSAQIVAGKPKITKLIEFDAETWDVFGECCLEVGNSPEQILRNAVKTYTRAHIMTEAERRS